MKLRGDHLQTDVSGSILITDVNTVINEINNDEAVHCQPELINMTREENGGWYLNRKKIDNTDTHGWTAETLPGVALLKRVSDSAEEGVFTCQWDGDINPSVSVGIYYPSKKYHLSSIIVKQNTCKNDNSIMAIVTGKKHDQSALK